MTAAVSCAAKTTPTMPSPQRSRWSLIGPSPIGTARRMMSTPTREGRDARVECVALVRAEDLRIEERFERLGRHFRVVDREQHTVDLLEHQNLTFRVSSPLSVNVATELRVFVQLDVREPVQQRGERDLAFEAREPGPQAEVGAAAERHDLRLLACDVEAVRLREDGRIAVARAEQDDDLFALRDRRLGDLDVRRRGSRRQLDRRVVAQQLLDGGLDGGAVLEQVQLVAVAQEREHAVADEVLRRLVSGDEDQDAQAEQLLLRQLLVVLLGGDERGQEVVARFLAAVLDEGPEVHAELRDRPHGLVQRVRRRHGVEDRCDLARPALERIAVLDGDTHQLADDECREAGTRSRRSRPCRPRTCTARGAHRRSVRCASGASRPSAA